MRQDMSFAHHAGMFLLQLISGPCMQSDIWLHVEHWARVLQPFWHILLIILLAAMLLRFTHRLVRVLKVHIIARNLMRDARRIDTLSNVFQHAATIIIIAIAGMLAMAEIGIAITPILATAGVAGIAIGFGAQSLVKDFFTGLFLLIENQVSEGDVIEVAGKAGLVEEITLRHIRMRDDDGSVHFIPNSSITILTNRSRGFAYAIIDFVATRNATPDVIFGMIQDVAHALRNDPAFASQILGDMEIEGIDRLDDALMTIRCRMKVKPLQQERIRREFLARMKTALDGIMANPAK